MAKFSSHLLNGSDGTHASNVKVKIYQIQSSKLKKLFLNTKTDGNGRITQHFNLSKKDCSCDYEMICDIKRYFKKKKIVAEIVIKFKMTDNKKNYHLPIIISPNSYTCLLYTSPSPRD